MSSGKLFMPLTIILFKNAPRDSELYASDSTRLAVAAASDAAVTIGAGLAHECHTILQRVLVSSQCHHPPASRAAAAPRPHEYRASCARWRGNSCARTRHALRPEAETRHNRSSSSRVKVFRAARAVPLLRVCRQVRRGQEVTPGAWLLRGERSVRRSSPRFYGGTTARWVSLRGQIRRRATLQSPRPCPCSSSNLSSGVPSHRGPRHSCSHRRCS